MKRIWKIKVGLLSFWGGPCIRREKGMNSATVSHIGKLRWNSQMYLHRIFFFAQGQGHFLVTESEQCTPSQLIKNWHCALFHNLSISVNEELHADAHTWLSKVSAAAVKAGSGAESYIFIVWLEKGHAHYGVRICILGSTSRAKTVIPCGRALIWQLSECLSSWLFLLQFMSKEVIGK